MAVRANHCRFGERGDGRGRVFYGSCGCVLPGGRAQGGGRGGGVGCGGRGGPGGGCCPLIHVGADERVGLQHEPIIGLHAPLTSKLRPNHFEYAGVVRVQPVTLPRARELVLFTTETVQLK